MLPFFRQIRQGLLTENKFSKYLLYAIGEIFLVMVGILLALQVNNWNEERQTDQAIHKVLLKLKADLYYDLEQFDMFDSIHATWKKQNDYIRNEVLSGKLKRLDSFRQFFAGRWTFYPLKIKNTTRQEMINTGLMYKLDSTSQRSIENYYELSRFETEKLNTDLQDYSNYLFSNERRKSISIAQRLSFRRDNLEYVDWSWLQNPNSEIYMELENTTGWYGGLINDYNTVVETLRKQANATIQTIEKKLKE